MRKGAVIAIIIVAILIIGGVVGFLVYTNMQKNDNSGFTFGGGSGSGSSLGFEADQTGLVRSSDPTVCIPGFDKAVIEANKTKVYMDLENPTENEGLFYLTYELKLADTGEVLYTSQLIKPGQTIKEITLSRPLSQGTYKAVLHVQPYTADDSRTPTYNADINFDLIVQ